MHLPFAHEKMKGGILSDLNVKTHKFFWLFFRVARSVVILDARSYNAMLSAARAKKACPQCRRQLLSLVENTFAGARSDGVSLAFAPALRQYRTTAHSITTSRTSRVSPRCYSTTPSKPDVADPDSLPSSNDDIETIVRQARHAFGDTLPKDYLNAEEYQLYLRLYGPPLRETQPEDVGMPVDLEAIAEEEALLAYESSDKVWLRETEDGRIEKIVHETEEIGSSSPPGANSEVPLDPAQEAITQLQTSGRSQDLPSGAGLTYIHAVAKNQRELDVFMRLQKDFEAASLRPDEEEIEDPVEEEEVEEEIEEEEEENLALLDTFVEHPSDRTHEYSRMGHWRTKPSTLQLPKADLVLPITELLTRTSSKHILEAAEKAFGGPGLPLSATTPRRNTEQKAIPLAAGHHRMSEIDADTFLATLFPAMYSTSMSVLAEIRKRLGPEWIAKLMARGNGEGPRVLDVGAGGAGLVAWEQVLQAEWSLARDKGLVTALEPPGKKTAVIGSEPLRQRVSRFIHNTSFLPRLPDYLHSGDHPDKLEGGEASLPRKQFDIIIASHQMMGIKEDFRRTAMLNNLWEMLSPEGGILIVLEKGHPRGFEAVADVRARLLDEFIVSPTSDPQSESIETDSRRVREPGMIVAPCTNHKSCPMYLTPGLTSGRKDFCHFSQRFIRPPFLQKVHGAAHSNHDDVGFSFIAVQRGTLPGVAGRTPPAQGVDPTEAAFEGYENSSEAPDPLSLPRNIMPPLKRQGHVTMDLCTPAGRLERWTVPKSFSKQAYRDARKAQWGDLWALGAKTRVTRPVRLGKSRLAPGDEDDGGEGIVKDANKDGKKQQQQQQQQPGTKPKKKNDGEKGKLRQYPRRTKNGRLAPRPSKKGGDEDLEELHL
ncbi:mitochondrial small ribosomal subunit Rsm22-domain-containing protein [Poronia punctata]|nr:mitochondrial small ribosomal subunit Rsm22-domain-containing protein [Poronia punctata]